MESGLIQKEDFTSEQQAYYDYTCQTGDYIKMCTVPSLQMDESDLVKKRQCYRHLFGVSTLCIAYSQYVQLDCELCAIMGLLHDYSVYKNNTSFNHAQLSSELARKMLEESLLFENEEIDIIFKLLKIIQLKIKFMINIVNYLKCVSFRNLLS